ncbi:response regulator [bacterium]|nr:response regulator [bacterium]
MNSRGPLPEQADRDLAKSGDLAALLIYPILGLCTGLASELWSGHRTLVYWEMALTGGIGGVRHYAGLSLRYGPADQVASAKRAYSLTILLTALCWSTYAATVVHFYGRSWTGLLVLLVTFGIVAASTANLISDFRLMRIYVWLMVLPSALTLAWRGGMPELLTAGLLVVFSAFMVSIGQRHTQRYWSLSRALIDLEQARRVAEQANQAKSVFLATMSHEIRTPMNAIVGLTHLLQDLPASTQQKEWLTALSHSSESLLGLISDILDLSKIEANQAILLNPAAVDLWRLLEELVHVLGPLARTKGLVLELEMPTDTPRGIVTDPVRLRQILVNLLGNAIKFSFSGSIKLAAERQGSQLQLSVWDQGLGIAAEHFHLVFQPFSQLDSRHGGTGLGLAISREMIKLMGGRLWLSSGGSICGEAPSDWKRPTPSTGSQFWIWLPLIETDLPLPEESPTIQVMPLKILVVEDNRVNQLVIRETLCRLGHSVKVVDSGEAALRALHQEPFNVVLMDVQMPEMDGLEATRQIRDKLSEQPWIVALTANALPEDRNRCLQAGMNDYLSKPVRRDELQKALARAALSNFT